MLHRRHSRLPWWAANLNDRYRYAGAPQIPAMGSANGVAVEV